MAADDLSGLDNNLPDPNVSRRTALTQRNFEAVLWKELHEDPALVPTRFPVDAPPIFRMLDSEFRTQVLAEAIRNAKAEFSELMVGSAPGDVEIALELARQAAFAEARTQRHLLFDLWTVCKDKRLLTTYGTANDEAWTPHLEAFKEIIAELAVEYGVSIINGGARVGLMGRMTEAVKEKIAAWNEAHPDAPTDSDVVLVLLRIYSSTSPEPPAVPLSARSMSHPIYTFMTRTRLMPSLGPGCVYIFPGGLGTFEEAAATEADEQIGARVVKDNVSQLANITYVNAEFTVSNPETGAPMSILFFDGMKEQHRRMDLIDSLKPQVKAAITYHEPGRDPEEDRAMVELFIDCCASSSSVHASPMDPHERQVREMLETNLDRNRTFNMSSFGPEASPYYHFLDAQYAGQVRLEAATLAMEDVLGRGAHNFEDSILESAVHDAASMAQHWRGQLRKLIAECEGDRTIVVSGSAKDSVIEMDPELCRYAERLVDRAILDNLTIVINGEGGAGIGKLLGNMWARRMIDFPGSTSKLVRLQLKMHDDMRPGRCWDGEGTLISVGAAAELTRVGERVIRERLGPPIASTMVRSHAALSLGKVQEVVVFPGDSVTMSFAAETLLARQLSEVTLTPFTGKSLPTVNFVNARLGEATGFFEGLQQQLSTFILCKTAKPHHLSGVQFLEP